jgi:hypothetical protein
MPKEKAYQSLKALSGEDFGDDIDAWEKWYVENEQQLVQAMRARLTNMK